MPLGRHNLHSCMQCPDGLHRQLCAHSVCVRYSIGIGLWVTLTRDLILHCLRKTWRQTGLAWLQTESELFSHKSFLSPAKRSLESLLLSLCHSSLRLVTRKESKELEKLEKTPESPPFKRGLNGRGCLFFCWLFPLRQQPEGGVAIEAGRKNNVV